MVVITQKSKKFAFYTYTDPNNGKVLHDNMPWRDWERIQRDRSRASYYKLERSLDLSEGKQEVFGVHPPAVVDDQLECPLCGFVAKDDADLKTHKQKKHT